MSNDLIEVKEDEIVSLVNERYNILCDYQADLLLATGDDDDDERFDAEHGMRREAEALGHFLNVAKGAGHDLALLFPYLPKVLLTAYQRVYASVV